MFPSAGTRSAAASPPPRLPAHRLQRSSGSVCELRLVFGESPAPFELAARQKRGFWRNNGCLYGVRCEELSDRAFNLICWSVGEAGPRGGESWIVRNQFSGRVSQENASHQRREKWINPRFWNHLLHSTVLGPFTNVCLTPCPGRRSTRNSLRTPIITPLIHSRQFSASLVG